MEINSKLIITEESKVVKILIHIPIHIQYILNEYAIFLITDNIENDWRPLILN